MYIFYILIYLLSLWNYRIKCLMHHVFFLYYFNFLCFFSELLKQKVSAPFITTPMHLAVFQIFQHYLNTCFFPWPHEENSLTYKNLEADKWPCGFPLHPAFLLPALPHSLAPVPDGLFQSLDNFRWKTYLS